jgi:hypothetical protein
MQRGSTFEDLVTRSKKMKTYCNSDTWVKSYSILNFLNTINYMTSVLFACVWRNRERLPINGSRGLVGLVFLPLSTFVTRDIKFPIWVVRWRLQFITDVLPRRVLLWYVLEICAVVMLDYGGAAPMHIHTYRTTYPAGLSYTSRLYLPYNMVATMGDKAELQYPIKDWFIHHLS